MSNNDYQEKLNVDEILEEVRNYGEDSEDGKIWSLSEIDALLSGDTARQFEGDDESSFSVDDILAEISGTKDGESKDGEEKDESILKEFDLSKYGEYELDDTVAPLIDSAEEEPEETPEEEPEEDETVPGQISIEKTRVFNEVEVRSVRKSDIDHQIGAVKVIKTGEVPGVTKSNTDPYRERFFNKPELNIEKTRDHLKYMQGVPQKTIERHGVVVKKSDEQKTDPNGVSPIPVLVDAADEYDAQHRIEADTQVASLRRNAFEDDNQIMLEGFEAEDEVEIVSEEQAEEELLRKRRAKASKFKLFPNLDEEDEDETAESEEETEEAAEETTEETEDIETEETAEKQTEDETPETPKAKKPKAQKERVRVERELFGPKDFKAVKSIYRDTYSKEKTKLIVCAVCFGILLLGSIITSAFESFALFGGSARVYSAVNLIALLVVAGFNYKEFITAIDKAKKKKANYSSVIALSLIVGAFQTAVSFLYPDLVTSGTNLYAAVALFCVLLISFGNYLKLDNDVKNFNLLERKQGKFYSVKAIEDDDKAFEIGRGLMIREPDVRYSAKVAFPYRFVEMTKTVDPTAESYKTVIPAAAVAAVVVALISALINRNIFYGITSLAGVFLMAMPIAVGASLFGLLRYFNDILNKHNSMISGYEAVDDVLETNAVAIDACELFSNGGANIYGIKLFNSMRIDEAILYTAAVVIHSNGALSEAFDASILQNHEMIPEVESLAYEEKLGCSGWIYNYRVLVGNRDLLLKHNVDVQSKEEEAEYTQGGNQALYLAVEGKVSAMFIVGYSADEKTAKYMRFLEKSGVSILVRTTDPNITEDLVEQHFGLPRNFIKVINPVAGVMLKDLRDTEIPTEPCRILSNGKLNMFLYSLCSALLLKEKSKMAVLLQYIGVGIGVLLMAMFSFLSSVEQAGVVQIILFEILWSLVVIFIPRIKKI